MTARDKVLICDDTHPLLAEALQEKYTVYFRPDIEQQEVNQLLPELSGIVINSKTKLYAPQIAAMKQGSWIARLGSGLDIIDVPAAQAKGILVIRTPGANANAVAEHAMGMLLCLLHQLHRADQSVRQGHWHREKHRGTELSGMTVGIIGHGENGSRMVQKLSSMGVTILVFDKYKQHIEDLPRSAYTVELTELKKRSDVISFHVPLDEDTYHYLDEEFLDGCQGQFYLINTSRGKVIKESALRTAIEEGQVLGACLDVFENEGRKAMDSEIMRFFVQSDKVLLSPHIAGWTHQSKRRIAQTIIKSLQHADFI